MARWRFTDELTGRVYWSDRAKEDWDGSIRHVKNCDGQHPDLREKRLPPDTEPKWITPEFLMPVPTTATTVTAYGSVSTYTALDGRTVYGPRG
jgi:hypothetical protein